MIELAPAVLPPSPKFEGPGTAATEEDRRARVIMLAGCAQQVLRPGINDSTIRLLARRGVDVVVAAGAGCCGALTHHLGDEASAIAFAKRNVDAWSKELAKGPVDAIVVNASGCGTMVKDYGHLLKREPEYAARAARISELARDISEFVGKYELGAPKRWSSLRVAYHPACSLQHGQGIKEEPRDLLIKAGYSVVDIPESHICCGSAGTYNILQPEIAGALRERKTKNIKRVKPDVVATGNIGCITQLAGSARRAGGAHGRAARLGLRRAGAAGPGAARALRVERARAQAPHRRLHPRLALPHRHPSLRRRNRRRSRPIGAISSGRSTSSATCTAAPTS